MFTVDTYYNGIELHAAFNTKIAVLLGRSGSGKSLCLKAIEAYCYCEQIPSVRITSEIQNLNEVTLKALTTGRKVLLFDNADLYLNRELLLELSKHADFVLVSSHNSSEIWNSGMSKYFVNYENRVIHLERF